MDSRGSIRWALAAEAARLRRELDAVLRELRKLEGPGLDAHNAEADRLRTEARERAEVIEKLTRPPPDGAT